MGSPQVLGLERDTADNQSLDDRLCWLSRYFDAYFSGCCGPFEKSPTVAVAVSGGRDSMALTLLLQEWAQKNNGHLIAVTVDHGLRPESAAEAVQVKDWLTAHGIEHHVLTLTRLAEVSGNRQAAARSARYRALSAFCRDHHILHLAIGHHQDDQAETLLLRLARGSGPVGLSAMAPVRYQDNVRLVRPLLHAPAAVLEDYLRTRDQDWMEDPSNADRQFDRVKIRQSLKSADLKAPDLAKTTRVFGRARQQTERQTARLLAKTLMISSGGIARLDWPGLCKADPEIRVRALSQVLQTCGDTLKTPRFEDVERLLVALNEREIIRTLNGAIVICHQGNLFITRESALAERCEIAKERSDFIWDGRFWTQIKVLGRELQGFYLASLGGVGWQQVCETDSDLKNHKHHKHLGFNGPNQLNFSLPALWCASDNTNPQHLDEVVCVPHLRYINQSLVSQLDDFTCEMVFSPQATLMPPMFRI